ncbi:unnamed protein product [Mytilus coruscus]|uniref:NADP-dependent oxidoreductase domain-containing protein n=1 Tax=Mytilus coruscus TaxID=42192 RepID=A0A6J8B223_MYTCO|nr:unnamed protein product [Mytilus coruscus]
MSRNEADVGRELKKSGLKKKMFLLSQSSVKMVTIDARKYSKKVWKSKLYVPYIDLYLVHSPKSGKIIETYKAVGIEGTSMGYAPPVKGQTFDDETLCGIAKRNNKSPAQILSRWSLQHGFITIPKSVHSGRIEENMLVFDWSLNDEDMAILVSTCFVWPLFGVVFLVGKNKRKENYNYIIHVLNKQQ